MRKSAQQQAEERDLVGEPEEKSFGVRAQELFRAVKEETIAHPLRSVGWAASAGFVLGGGLFTPLTGRTLRAGLHLALRLAILPALTRGLAQVSSRILDDTNGYGPSTQAEEKS